MKDTTSESVWPMHKETRKQRDALRATLTISKFLIRQRWPGIGWTFNTRKQNLNRKRGVSCGFGELDQKGSVE